MHTIENTAISREKSEHAKRQSSCLYRFTTLQFTRLRPRGFDEDGQRGEYDRNYSAPWSFEVLAVSIVLIGQESFTQCGCLLTALKG